MRAAMLVDGFGTGSGRTNSEPVLAPGVPSSWTGALSRMVLKSLGLQPITPRPASKRIVVKRMSETPRRGQACPTWDVHGCEAELAAVWVGGGVRGLESGGTWRPGFQEVPGGQRSRYQAESQADIGTN